MIKNYKAILVAVDGSEASKQAMLKAIKLAKENEAKLVITHVIDTTIYSTSIVLDLNYSEKAETYANELMERFKKQAIASNIKDVVTHLDYGSPKTKIPKQIAKDYQADLIVCGATGHNAMERFLIGSVSENITRLAKVDVLVVRPEL